MSGNPTFYDWLAERRTEDSSLGNLARNAYLADDIPVDNLLTAWEAYLRRHQSSAPMYATLHNSWGAYIRYLKSQTQEGENHDQTKSS